MRARPRPLGCQLMRFTHNLEPLVGVMRPEQHMATAMQAGDEGIKPCL